MPSETIAIANDHGGFDLKNALKRELSDLGFAVLDLGSDNAESVDYPDFGYAMASAIERPNGSRMAGCTSTSMPRITSGMSSR